MDVGEVRRRLIAKWTSKSGLELIRAGGPLVQSLLLGKPVSLQQAGALICTPADQVPTWWAERNYILECDHCGNIVGAGITLLPTRHSFEIDGRTLYAWCAMDCLMFAVVMKKDARIRSSCPATGAPISLTVTVDGVKDVSPATVAVSLAAPEGPDIRKAFCDRTNFYVSREVAETATAGQLDVAVATLAEAFQVGVDLAKLF